MRKLILILALLSVPFISAPSAQALQPWGQATCQPGSPPTLWYQWNDDFRAVTYWRYNDLNYVKVSDQFRDYYGSSGYECGWLGDVRTPAWIQQVCEYGYCGTGTIQAFRWGQIVRHYGGWAAGQVVAYSY